MKQYGAIEGTFYFWFAGNDTSGSGGDGSSPAADVRLAGAAVDAIPVLSPTPTLLTHANYPAGCYEVAVAATTANGFAANNTYAVFCTLAIDSQNPTGFIGCFDLKPVKTLLTGDSYAVVNHADHGNAKLVRSTVPANKLDISATGEVGLDFANIKNATGAHTLTNITVPTCTANSDMRGTDGANTTVPDAAGIVPTAVENRQEMDSNSTQLAATLSKLLKYVQLLARSDAAIATDNATELTAINADGGSGAGDFSNQTDAEEAIRDVVSHGTYGNSALQVLIAALQTDLDNGTDGLGALKTLIDAVPTASEIQTEMEENGASLLDTIRDDLANATDGLGALKTLIDAVNTDLSNETDGLGALKTLIDTVNTDLSNGTDGLGALKALIEAVPTAAETKTAIEAAGSHLTLIKEKTDNLPSGIAKNVALSAFTFYMVLTSDHVTAATGKTLTGQISKDGGVFAGLTNSIAEIGNGLYKVDITQAEMNADVVTLKFTETDCDQRVITIYTS